MLVFDEKTNKYIEVTGGLQLHGKSGKRILDTLKNAEKPRHEALHAAAEDFNDAVMRDGRLCKPQAK